MLWKSSTAQPPTSIDSESLLAKAAPTWAAEKTKSEIASWQKPDEVAPPIAAPLTASAPQALPQTPMGNAEVTRSAIGQLWKEKSAHPDPTGAPPAAPTAPPASPVNAVSMLQKMEDRARGEQSVASNQDLTSQGYTASGVRGGQVIWTRPTPPQGAGTTPAPLPTVRQPAPSAANAAPTAGPAASSPPSGAGPAGTGTLPLYDRYNQAGQTYANTLDPADYGRMNQLYEQQKAVNQQASNWIDNNRSLRIHKPQQFQQQLRTRYPDYHPIGIPNWTQGPSTPPKATPVSRIISRRPGPTFNIPSFGRPSQGATPRFAGARRR